MPITVLTTYKPSGNTLKISFSDGISTATSTAIPSQCNIVRLTTDANVRFNFGMTSTASAATTLSTLLRANQTEYFTCPPGCFVSGYGAGSGGTLEVQPMTS